MPKSIPSEKQKRESSNEARRTTSGFEATRPASWSKIRFLREHLDEYDWLFWTDVDSLIMNQSVRLEQFIDEECDVVICHEDLGIGLYNVNAGQILVRSTAWSRWFLDEIWGQQQFIDDPLWEQRAIIHLLWSRDLSDHVQVVSQRRFNAYPENYVKGDFLLHFPNRPLHERVRLMRQFTQFSY